MENEIAKNMKIYEAVRQCPQEAQREITAGRLKGKTDINPMWRIKTLTEQFGVAGFGWYTETTRKWIERNENTGEAIANVDINLYIKIDGEWSKPIEGTGGAMFISNESKGVYTDDDAYKKAYTDAISVACKAIGMAGDIYWAKDPTKYTQGDTAEKKPQDAPQRTEGTKTAKNTTESTNRASAQNLGAQGEQGAQGEKPAIMDDAFFAKELMTLVAGEAITYDQLEAISRRDFGCEISQLDANMRKQFYINTKQAVERLKKKKANQENNTEESK